MDNELISVVVPVYNVQEYLHSCVDSLLRQTYRNLEIILVDDGSTDESGSICDDYSNRDARIKVLHKANGGLSDARNAGIEVATGLYLTMVDSDDWVADNYVELLYKAISNNDVDIAIGRLSEVSNRDDKGFLAEVDKSQTFDRVDAVSNYLYQRFSTSANAKMYSRKIYKDLAFPVGVLYEDLEPIYLAISKSSRVAFCDSAIYKYYQRNTGIVRGKMNPRKFDYVSNAESLLYRVKSDYPQLERAAISRKLWAEVHIIVHMNNFQEYPEEFNKFWSDIKRNRMTVIADANNKLNVRMVAGLSFLGPRFIRQVYRLK